MHMGHTYHIHLGWINISLGFALFISKKIKCKVENNRKHKKKKLQFLLKNEVDVYAHPELVYTSVHVPLQQEP